MGLVEVGLERTIDTRVGSARSAGTTTTRPTLRVETIEVLECIKSSGTSSTPPPPAAPPPATRNYVRDRDVTPFVSQRLLSPRVSIDDSTTLADFGVKVIDIQKAREPDVLRYRTIWLLVLLTLQSVSSYILSSFQPLIMAHPCIILFLTMLIGAGGNAGSQSAILTVRAITLYEQQSRRRALRALIKKEMLGAFRIAAILSIACYMRVQVVDELHKAEVIGLCASMFSIVFISIMTGVLLPLTLWRLGIDPAHSGAAIQVFADIAGVTVTCVCTGLATVLLPAAVKGSAPPEP